MTRPAFEEWTADLWRATDGVCAVEIVRRRDGFEVTPFVREQAREGPHPAPDLAAAMIIGEAILERTVADHERRMTRRRRRRTATQRRTI